MEIFIVIGMAIAFFLGAHIRKPFEFHINKPIQPIQPIQKEEKKPNDKPSLDEQWDNVFNH